LEWSGRRELSEADRLRAALIVAKRRDKRSLAPMIELLAAQDRIVATRASMALRRLTGETIALPTGDAPGVAATIRQWKTWLASSPATLELNVESLRAKGRRSALNGNTLIALGYKNRVVELGPDGEEVWSCDAQGVWSAEKIESGEILVACYQENKVKLIAPDKTVSWEFDVLGVLKARSLENGNVLVASHSGNRVLEINPDKKVVWEYIATTQCHDAVRLETGNTLVCTANDVLEIEPSGNVVWRFPAEQAYGIDALPDGNVLIAKLGGEVIEVDRGSNDIVWTFEFPSPVDVYRTEQGTTLVTGANSVVEIDAEKIPLWTKEICNFGSARK
jgi:outer membrane protein assembly factor BamB